jgi:hypothetical protein
MSRYRFPHPPGVKELPKRELEALENFIDKHGIHDVLYGIEEICYVKAEWLEEKQPQDHALAREWIKAGFSIDRACKKIGDL